MEQGVMIRCTQCGYKNSPVYHYCGECGAVLQAAPVTPKEVAPAPVPPSPKPPAPPPPQVEAQKPLVLRTPASESSEPPITGMSFLGLSDAPRTGGSDYLLDEEPESRPWGKYIIVAILFAAAIGFGWQWQNGGFPFNKQAESKPATPAPTAETQPSAATATPVANAPAAAPAEAAPAATTEPAKTADAAPTTEAKTDSAASAPVTKPEAAPEPKTAEATPPKTEPAPEKTAAAAAPVEKPAKPVARVKTPVPVAEPVVSPGEALFSQGQKYLYGNGVPANCDLATKSLLAAAARAHAQAQSTLGTMYYTGHCVNRDLPTAYRWFAKALRADPGNTRLEQNLSVVWRDMTPEERQTATKGN